MYQKLFENWRTFKKTLNEYEVEPIKSDVYGKTFQDFLNHLPSSSEISEAESALEAESGKKESELPPGKQMSLFPSSGQVVDSPQAAKRFANKIWIFFDTETTGLKTGPFDQITQIAALAVDPKGFAEGSEPVEVGRFNKKLNLAMRTRARIAYEKEDTPRREYSDERKKRYIRSRYKKVAPGIYRGQPMSPFQREENALMPLSLTKYGISPDEEKRKRKAYIEYVAAEQEAGREPMSFEEFPTPPGPELIQHGPQVMQDFLDFIDQFPNRILVAQNAAFDVAQINFMLRRVKIPVTKEKVFDTYKFFEKHFLPILKSLNEKRRSGQEMSEADIAFARSLTKNGKDTVSLGYLVKAFKLVNKGWHDAFADVQMLHDALRACIIFLQSRPEFMSALANLPPKKERAPRPSQAKPRVPLRVVDIKE